MLGSGKCKRQESVEDVHLYSSIVGNLWVKTDEQKEVCCFIAAGKKHTNTTFSHLQLAHLVRSSPILCMVIEDVEIIKKGANHFFDPS